MREWRRAAAAPALTQGAGQARPHCVCRRPASPARARRAAAGATAAGPGMPNALAREELAALASASSIARVALPAILISGKSVPGRAAWVWHVSKAEAVEWGPGATADGCPAAPPFGQGGPGAARQRPHPSPGAVPHRPH